MLRVLCCLVQWLHSVLLGLCVFWAGCLLVASALLFGLLVCLTLDWWFRFEWAF